MVNLEENKVPRSASINVDTVLNIRQVIINLFALMRRLNIKIQKGVR